MLTPTETIRKILDAATADDLSAATKALNDYADQKYQVKKISPADMNVEEVRKHFPQPINELP